MHRILFAAGQLLALCLLLSGTSWAHPHVFLSAAVKIVFDDKGLAGMEIRWVYDQMYSGMVLLDVDRNRNGRLEPGEIESLRKGPFRKLKGLDYFTHIKINGKPFQVKYLTGFHAEIRRGRLYYQFFVPCHVRAVKAFKTLTVSIYDISYYHSVRLVRDPVIFENREPYEINLTIRENKAEAYYYGQVYPEEITLEFRRRRE